MNFFEWLKSFLSEPDGKGSSRRIIEFALSWTFIFSYVKVALSTQALPPMDMAWVFLLGSILGLKTLDTYVKLRNGNGKESS